MRIIIKITFFLLMTFLSNDTNATGQFPDKIVIDNKEYFIQNNPLEPYFYKYPEKRPKAKIMSSALHRGYNATFTLVDNKLYLIDIKIKKQKNDSDESGDLEMVSVFDEVFPDQNRIVMDLFNGVLIVHLNLEDPYEKREKLLIEFRNGLEQERRIYDNQKFKNFIDAQFELYKTTEEYKESFAELKKLDDKIENEDKFIESLIRTYTPNFTTKFLD